MNNQKISRFGGLSLGESRDLVNDVVFDPELNGLKGKWLFNDPKGKNLLPIWVDHVGSKRTVWGNFNTAHAPLPGKIDAHDARWIKIRKE